jgi:sialate O-acetylesterase
MKKRLLFLFVAMTCFVRCAQVRLPKIFGDSMVLQRDQPIPVWGWAGKKRNGHDPVSTIKRKRYAPAATASGKTTLNPEQAGGPYTLQVNGKNAITLKEVLVGDVWICSGQSNMEWPVSASNNAASEIASANYLQIRHIKVVNDVGERPVGRPAP